MDMTVKDSENLEAYFHDTFQHWNDYIFNMVCDVVRKGIFDNPLKCAKLFKESYDLVIENCEAPINALQKVCTNVNQAGLTIDQKIFLLGALWK